MAMKLENSFGLLAKLKGEQEPPSAAKKPPSERLTAPPRPPPERSNGRKKARRRTKEHKKDQNESEREESKIDDKTKKTMEPRKVWPKILRKFCIIFFLFALFIFVGFFVIRRHYL